MSLIDGGVAHYFFPAIRDLTSASSPDLAKLRDTSALQLSPIDTYRHLPISPTFHVLLDLADTPNMPPGPKLKQQPLSRELSEGIQDAGTFENIPKIKTIAGASVGQ